MPTLSDRLAIPLPNGSDNNSRAQRMAELRAIDATAAQDSDLQAHKSAASPHTGHMTNYGNSPGDQAGLDAARPAATGSGRTYWATDTAITYRDVAIGSWQKMAVKDWGNLDGRPLSLPPSPHASTHAFTSSDPITPLSIRAVDRTGDTMSGGLTISAGGIVVQAGGASIQNGGLTIGAGGITVNGGTSTFNTTVVTNGGQTQSGAADGTVVVATPPALTAAGTQVGVRNVLRANSFDSVNHSRDFILRASTSSNAGAGYMAFLTAIDAGAVTEVGRVDSTGLWTLANGIAITAGGLTLTAGPLVLPSYADFTEIATPAFPTAGRMRMYPKTNGNFYTLDSTGLERPIGTGSGSRAYALAMAGI